MLLDVVGVTLDDSTLFVESYVSSPRIDLPLLIHPPPSTWARGVPVLLMCSSDYDTTVLTLLGLDLLPPLHVYDHVLVYAVVVGSSIVSIISLNTRVLD